MQRKFQIPLSQVRGPTLEFATFSSWSSVSVLSLPSSFSSRHFIFSPTSRTLFHTKMFTEPKQAVSSTSRPPILRVLRSISFIGHDPPLRHEWRALSEEEKMDFIGAVQCLTQRPSKLGLNTTRYDDFVYVHVNLYSESKCLMTPAYSC